jgi:hypothetical protein
MGDPENKVTKSPVSSYRVLFLCERCQDIVEFGYHSFPAYHLDEKQKISKEEHYIK